MDNLGRRVDESAKELPFPRSCRCDPGAAPRPGLGARGGGPELLRLSRRGGQADPLRRGARRDRRPLRQAAGGGEPRRDGLQGGLGRRRLRRRRLAAGPRLQGTGQRRGNRRRPLRHHGLRRDGPGAARPGHRRQRRRRHRGRSADLDPPDRPTRGADRQARGRARGAGDDRLGVDLRGVPPPRPGSLLARRGLLFSPLRAGLRQGPDLDRLPGPWPVHPRRLRAQGPGRLASRRRAPAARSAASGSRRWLPTSSR